MPADATPDSPCQITMEDDSDIMREHNEYIAITGTGRPSKAYTAPSQQEIIPFLRNQSYEGAMEDVQPARPGCSGQQREPIVTDQPNTYRVTLITPDEAGDIYIPQGKYANARDFIEMVYCLLVI